MKVDYVSIPKDNDYVYALQINTEGKDTLIENGVSFCIRKGIGKGNFQELSPTGWVDNYDLTINELGISKTNASILYIPLSSELSDWITNEPLEFIIDENRFHFRPKDSLFRVYEEILWEEDKPSKRTAKFVKIALPLLVVGLLLGGAYGWANHNSPTCDANDLPSMSLSPEKILEPNQEIAIPVTEFFKVHDKTLAFSGCKSSNSNITTSIDGDKIRISSSVPLQQNESIKCEVKNSCGQTQLVALNLIAPNTTDSLATESAQIQPTLEVYPNEFTLQDHDMSMPIDILSNNKGDDLTIKKCTKIYTRLENNSLIFDRPKIMPENTYKSVNFDCQIVDKYGDMKVNHVDINVEILALDLNIPKSQSQQDQQFDLATWIKNQTGWKFTEKEFSCRELTLPLGTTFDNGLLFYNAAFEPTTTLCMIQFSSYRPTLIKVNISNN